MGMAAKWLASSQPVSAPKGSLIASPWAAVFDRNRTTYVANTDSALVLVQDMLGRRILPADYLKPRFGLALGAGNLDRTAAEIPNRYYTSLTSARIVARLAQTADGFGAKVDIRLPRHMQVREVKENTTVALLPNFTGGGNVLILSSGRMEAIGDAAEFLLNDAKVVQILERLHLVRDGRPRYFELLLRSSRVERTTIETAVLAHRVVEDDPSRR